MRKLRNNKYIISVLTASVVTAILYTIKYSIDSINISYPGALKSFILNYGGWVIVFYIVCILSWLHLSESERKKK